MSVVDWFNNSYKVRHTRAALDEAWWFVRGSLRRLSLPALVRGRSDVQIHFGCGAIADPRFINVDARPMPHVHLVTKSPLLQPFGVSTANSLYACHVFEHLTFLRQEAILKRWFQILKPGGTLRLSVPDFDKIVDIYQRSGNEVRSVQAELMGGQDYPGNFHCAIFTADHLRQLLERSGFVEIEHWHPRELDAWPKDHSWSDHVSLNLKARKP